MSEQKLPSNTLSSTSDTTSDWDLSSSFSDIIVVVVINDGINGSESVCGDDGDDSGDGGDNGGHNGIFDVENKKVSKLRSYWMLRND